MPSDITGDNTPSKTPEQKPVIRTMRSDAETLFREKKPSLGEIIAKTSLRREAPGEGKPAKFYLLIAAGIILCVGTGGLALSFFFPALLPFSFFDRQGTDEPALPRPRISPSFFRTEKTASLGARRTERTAFLEKVSSLASAPAEEGKITALAITIEGEPEERFATLDDFFTLSRIQTPPEFFSRIEGPPMFFFGGIGNETRFGFAARTRDPDRTLADMIKWEPSLPGDFSPLFFGKTPPLVFPPFEDHTTQNVDWRSLTLSKERRIGIHYALFPSGNVLIVTTDKPLMENIITRMLHK